MIKFLKLLFGLESEPVRTCEGCQKRRAVYIHQGTGRYHCAFCALEYEHAHPLPGQAFPDIPKEQEQADLQRLQWMREDLLDEP